MRIALLAMVVLGCGDNRNPFDEITMDTFDEPPVSITVTRQSVPLAGIPVVFHRDDGTLVESITTDARGRAAAKPGPNGFVTAITDFAATRDLKTFLGVQPGDELTLDGAPNLTTPMMTYKVLVTPVAGAVFYRVSVRCLVGTGEQVPVGTNPVELSVTTRCLAPTETLVVALDGFGFPIESVLGAEATPTENGVVDLTNEVPVTAETATLMLSNVGSNATLESARAIGRTQFLAKPEQQVANGSHPTVFPDLAGASQTVAVTGARPVFVWGPAEPQTQLDVAAAQVEAVTELLFDRSLRTVSWSGGADGNFVFGQLVVEAPTSGLWSFVGPGGSAITLPALDAFPINAATRIELELGVGRVSGSVVDDLRRDGGWLDANNGLQARQRTMFTFQSLAAFGTLGLAFATTNLTF